MVDGSHDISDFDDPPIPKSVRILEVHKTEYNLSGRDAVYLKMKAQNPDTDEIFINIEIYTKKGTGKMRYTIRMMTPVDLYEERVETLNYILTTFTIDK